MAVVSSIDELRLGELRIRVATQGTTSTIQLFGECDLAQQETMRTVVRNVFEVRPECVVLDLSGLSFIDSSGIHVVIEMSARAEREDIRLVVCRGPQSVQRAFELCGLNAHLTFVPNGGNGRNSRETP